MTQLSIKAVKDFQELVKKKRGIILSDEKARSMALEWLSLFKLIYEPLREEKHAKRKNEKN